MARRPKPRHPGDLQQVVIRFRPEDVAAIDEKIKRQPYPPTRESALRELILGHFGIVPKPARGSSPGRVPAAATG